MRIKYCTQEEFEKEGLNPNAIILDKMWSELKSFLNYTPKEYKRRNDNTQEELLRWTNIL